MPIPGRVIYGQVFLYLKKLIIMIYKTKRFLITQATFYKDKQDWSFKMLLSYATWDKIKKLFLNTDQINELFQTDIIELVWKKWFDDVKEMFKSLVWSFITFEENYKFDEEDFNFTQFNKKGTVK